MDGQDRLVQGRRGRKRASIGNTAPAPLPPGGRGEVKIQRRWLGYRESIFTTLIIEQPGPGMSSGSGLLGEREGWLKDAADECRHGRLAGDRTPPCGCYAE